MGSGIKAGILSVSLVLLLGCHASESNQVCSNPVEIDIMQAGGYGPRGVDILVVVDNTESMQAVQKKLSMSIYSLITTLKAPVGNNSQIDEMRVAFVSSDMGLQYGEGQIEDLPFVETCEEPLGDNGTFYGDSDVSVEIPSGFVECTDDGNQCPGGFSCQDGLCVTFDGNPGYIDCSNILTSEPWIETSLDFPNENLASQVACRSMLGTSGCQVEQPLKAAVRSLQLNELEPEEFHFLNMNHRLFILLVSDEEDCSIVDPDLFETPEWESGMYCMEDDPISGHLSTACNYPPSNETDFLLSQEDYYDQLVELIGIPSWILFSVITGVPMDTVCQGRGNQIEDCLDSPGMQLEERLYENPKEGNEYYDFAPACTYEVNGEIKEAKPGRRLVKTAQSFFDQGSVHSLCNDDWKTTVQDIEKMLRESIGGSPFPKPLPWEPAPSPGCDDCGSSTCEMYARVGSLPSQDNAECPSGFDNPDGIFDVSEDTGDYTQLLCPIPKLSAPFSCTQTVPMYAYSEEVAWYYCENTDLEDFNFACDDGLDNDNDGLTDCDDFQDCGDCGDCEGTGINCENRPMYNVGFTTEARRLSRGYSIELHCPVESTNQDQNCSSD